MKQGLMRILHTLFIVSFCLLSSQALHPISTLHGLAKSKAVFLATTYILRYTKHSFFAPKSDYDDQLPFLTYLQPVSDPTVIAATSPKTIRTPKIKHQPNVPQVNTNTLTIPSTTLSSTANPNQQFSSTYLTKEELKMKFGIPISNTVLTHGVKQSVARRRLSWKQIKSGFKSGVRKVFRKLGFYSLTTKAASERIIESTATIAEVDGRFLMQKRLLPSIQETEKLHQKVSRYPVPFSVVESLMKIKYELLTQVSSTDRGFTTTRNQRMMIDTIIEFLHEYIDEHVSWLPELACLTGTSVVRNTTVNYPQSLENWKSIANPPKPVKSSLRNRLQPIEKVPEGNKNAFVPLEGVWKMVYTSAYDVKPLAANPLFIPQDIYQVIHRNGTTFNVIDVIPRVQTMLPPKRKLDKPSMMDALEGNALRLIVTLASQAASETRIQVGFRAIEARIKQNLLPYAISSKLPSTPIPPMKFKIGIPRFPQRKLQQFSLSTLIDDVKTIFNPALSKETPGYFDILYLDDDLLVTKQARPGGYFVFTRESTSIEDFFTAGEPY